MKYCEKCKKNVDDNATVCPDCGGALVKIVDLSIRGLREKVAKKTTAKQEGNNIKGEITEQKTSNDTPKIKRCWKCNKQVLIDAQFCPYCGSTVKSGNTPDQQVEDVHTNPQDVRTAKYCEKCQKQVPSEAQRCPDCGGILIYLKDEVSKESNALYDIDVEKRSFVNKWLNICAIIFQFVAIVDAFVGVVSFFVSFAEDIRIGLYVLVICLGSAPILAAIGGALDWMNVAGNDLAAIRKLLEQQRRENGQQE